ncbi:deoxyribose-phosphate aldolase [Ureaplasma urealyticum serovar 10 str. ATCC 33699]|uniref:Deoxyribose-phosphate aldolase n=1 Tax=Ureaplasma urealyticum serovar 10 (strain ATCC 33699 / Western) TaxID=565575 RepID=DEOC_UREU1|nr:deoxyribose-phosphate aldolase [Ureaplasma urealyticum]B5ZCA0.1 RecName: Full=Deoxyribose-phosphate aldolase; Short=DERA; AltName: Full=2-deoxy-D-ribose 5-phosphate aldolase; AltName: Full=Phosphodeoxyriboaldolase; Short=Deoxyriboaldolase [Ureaplasma urealyticum serovar 10 str. ATCC 33699]ACI59746.1 deoxyribose-phosphate aldolase [Ureaplasma urealyticum serovar 10 str. ATCC 33699]
MNKYSIYVDHTLLKPDASLDEIHNLCEEAEENEFYSVCINPCFIKVAKHYLLETPVKICTVVGFPLGANTTETKVFETRNAIALGADEIDMVININQLKSANREYCLQEINEVKKACSDKVLKVIVETALLDQEQKEFAARIILESDADFIKTSTGFAKEGAKLEDIILWKQILGDAKQIKAAGGIKNLDDFKAFIDAGATRIGTSSAIKILNNQ